MDQLQTVLLVILGIGAAIFLIVAIAVAFVLFKILSNVRRITERLDETSENLGQMAKYLGTKIGPATASAIASVLWRRFKSSGKRKSNKDD
jgi:membrane protein implicated in regulation of membrane protease activity